MDACARRQTTSPLRKSPTLRLPRSLLWADWRSWRMGAGMSRRSWLIGFGVAVLAVIAFLVGLVAASDDDSSRNTAGPQPTTACEAGVRWQQHNTPYADGTVLGVDSPPQVAIMRGGAKVGFPSPAEFAAMGLTE